MVSTTSFRYQPALWFAVLLLGVVGIEYLIIHRADFASRAALPAAVTFDLLVGLPLLFYWQLVRPYRLPTSTVVGAFGGAVAVAYCLLPLPQHSYLGWTRYALVALEGLALTLAVLNLRRLVRAFKSAQTTETGFPETLAAAATAVFNRAFAPLVAEVSMCYYALLSWRAPAEVQPTDRVYASHQESAAEALLGTVALLSVAEMGAVHLLLKHWWPNAAGWALAIHAYGLLFLLAHIRAIRLRPTLITTSQELLVRVGFLWRVRVPLARVATAVRITDAPAPSPGQLNTARMLLTPPNILLAFDEPVSATGPYGLRRTVHRLSLYVDQPAAFLAAVQADLPPVR